MTSMTTMPKGTISKCDLCVLGHVTFQNGMVRVAGGGIRDSWDDLLGVEGAQERASRRGRLLERLLMQCPMYQALYGDPILRRQVRGGDGGIIFGVRGRWLRQSI
jgi:hypothetical protein